MPFSSLYNRSISSPVAARRSRPVKHSETAAALVEETAPMVEKTVISEVEEEKDGLDKHRKK